MNIFGGTNAEEVEIAFIQQSNGGNSTYYSWTAHYESAIRKTILDAEKSGHEVTVARFKCSKVVDVHVDIVETSLWDSTSTGPSILKEVEEV